ncbi:MAG: YbaB/EbfC family nucleoid-associated protein [Candidatus Berkiella sp.]
MDSNDLKKMMTELMQNAQKMQENMQHSNKIVTGKSGGGLVEADANMQMQIVRLALNPPLFEEKPEVMSDLIMAAVNAALQSAKETVKQEMMEAAKKMGGGNFGF